MDTSSIYEFNINDILYCYYGNLLYEAKCLKRRIASDGEIEYFIHYCGFKKRYDEWVEKDRVLEINDTNIVHKSTLEYYQSKRKRTYNKTKDKVDKKTSDSSQPPKKRGRPYKNAKIEQCIAPSETPESDIGKIDSNVQSTETYCTPVPLKSIETPVFDIEESNVSIIKSTGTRSSSRPNKDVNIAKSLSHRETSKLGIGKINSEVQSTETYCTPVPLKSIETPGFDIEESNVSIIKSTGTRSSSRPNKDVNTAKCLSHCETSKLGIGKINSEVQSTETYCTPVPPKSIKSPRPYVKKSSVSNVKSSATRESSRPNKDVNTAKCLSHCETSKLGIGKINSEVQSTETYCTPVPPKSIKSPRPYVKKSSVSNVKSSATRESSRPNKDVNIAKCLSHCETSKLGIGKINSEVQSTETYCTPVSPKSIKTPRPYVKKSSVSKFKSSATRESNRSYKTPKFGKYISPYETPESDIGKIDSNVQPTETNCTPIPLKSIETPGFDMEESNVSITKSTGTRSSSRPNKDVNTAKCLSHCETSKLGIGKINSEVQSTETYCTPVSPKSIKTPRPYVKKSSVSKFKSSATRESNRSYKTPKFGKYISPYETPESDIGKIDSNVQPTETNCTPIPLKSIETPGFDMEESNVSIIKSTGTRSSSRPNKDVKIAKCIAPCETPESDIGIIDSNVQSTETYCTPIPLKSIETPGFDMEESNVSIIKPTGTCSSSRPNKDVKIAKCIAPCETPESDIGIIDSNVQSTETYCTPIPLKSIETPGLDMEESNVSTIKSTGTCSSSRPYENVNIAKCVAPCETPESDIGIIDSNVQSTETYCTPIPSISSETPVSDINESSVSEIKSIEPCSSSTALSKELADHLEISLTLKPNNTKLFGVDTVSFSQSEFTEFIKEDKKYTETINIAKNFTLSFSTDVPQATLPPIKIPPLITDIINDDWVNHNQFQKVLDFPNVHTVADLIYDFIKIQKSLHTISGEKAHIYGITLLNLFNYVVNKQLLYQSERKCFFQNKSFHNWFMKGRADKSRIYVLKEFLVRKKVWCYAYGPVHLMRLFVNLSKRTLTDDKELAISAGSPGFLQFVENNVSKYFSERHYISTDDLLSNTNVNLNSSTTDVIQSSTT